MKILTICNDSHAGWASSKRCGSSGPAVMYASLLLAAIPTSVVFILCQNVILRGIVVPVEK